MAARLLFAVALLTLGACHREPAAPPETDAMGSAPTVADGPPPPLPPGAPHTLGAQPLPLETGDACGASKLGDFANTLPTDETIAKIRAAAGERTTRVIRPGDAITMDFAPARLNVEVATDGRIKSFRCG